MAGETHTTRVLAAMHREAPKFAHTIEERIEVRKAQGELATSLLADIKQELTPEQDRRVRRKEPESDVV